MAWFFEVFVLGCDRQLWECAEPLQALKCASRELLGSRVGYLFNISGGSRVGHLFTIFWILESLHNLKG